MFEQLKSWWHLQPKTLLKPMKFLKSYAGPSGFIGLGPLGAQVALLWFINCPKLYRNYGNSEELQP
jgi:hypothetical protein